MASPNIRPQRRQDSAQVRGVLAEAFNDTHVVALETSLEAREDSWGFVAEIESRVVGHVRLTRAWIDAEDRPVEALVLGPLSVVPAWQGQGIGRALAAHAVEAAAAMGAPAVFLEGDPAYYRRLGWRAASELGVTPPSARIPRPAFQAIRFDRWDDSMRGALVYPEPFWATDCVGLRGERLRSALGGVETQ